MASLPISSEPGSSCNCNNPDHYDLSPDGHVLNANASNEHDSNDFTKSHAFKEIMHAMEAVIATEANGNEDAFFHMMAKYIKSALKGDSARKYAEYDPNDPESLPSTFAELGQEFLNMVARKAKEEKTSYSQARADVIKRMNEMADWSAAMEDSPANDPAFLEIFKEAMVEAEEAAAAAKKAEVWNAKKKAVGKQAIHATEETAK